MPTKETTQSVVINFDQKNELQKSAIDEIFPSYSQIK